MILTKKVGLRMEAHISKIETANYEQDLAHFRHISLLISNISDEYERKFLELHSSVTTSYVTTTFKPGAMIRIMRPIFRIVRRLADKLHIKARLKRTKLYRKLFTRGIIDKMQ